MNIIQPTQYWSEEQIQYLYNLFPIEKKEIVLEKIRKNWRNICKKAKEAGLHRKCKIPRNWTLEDIEKLKQIYSSSNRKTLKKEFPNKKIHTIEAFANKRGLQRSSSILFGRGRKGDLRILLEEKNESYYWIGFIFADGYIHHSSNQLVVPIDVKDLHHLEKYAKYVSGSVKIYESIKNFDGNKYKSKMARVSIAQKEVTPKIIEKFNFLVKKTYNPPNVDILNKILDTKEKFLSFFCGFVDGDGSMNLNGYSIKIQNHGSWIRIYDFFVEKLCQWLNLNKLDFLVKIDKNGYSIFSMKNKKNLNSLKVEIQKLNIPFMERKWFRIK